MSSHAAGGIGPIICHCQQCGVRHVLGVNAWVTVPKEGPDSVVLLKGQTSWPEWQTPPFPTTPVPSEITEARDRNQHREWKCRTKDCNTVQPHSWVPRRETDTIPFDDDDSLVGAPSVQVESPAAIATEPIRFACPTCGKTVKVPAQFAGKRGKCPNCKGVVAIPLP